MQRSFPLLVALGIAALGATASAQTTIKDTDKSSVAVDASRDMNQDNDKITTTVSKNSMSEKTRIEDSFQDKSKTTTNSFNKQLNDSTNLSNVGNGLSKPVAVNTLKAAVSGNRVLNVAAGGATAANVPINGSLNGFKGVASVNVNTGANSIQQSAISIAAVTHSSY